MSSKEQGQQLLETIDAVLAECSKDPRRRSTARPQPHRPAWAGPRWSLQQWQGQAGGPDEAEPPAP